MFRRFRRPLVLLTALTASLTPGMAQASTPAPIPNVEIVPLQPPAGNTAVNPVTGEVVVTEGSLIRAWRGGVLVTLVDTLNADRAGGSAPTALSYPDVKFAPDGTLYFSAVTAPFGHYTYGRWSIWRLEADGSTTRLSGAQDDRNLPASEGDAAMSRSAVGGGFAVDSQYLYWATYARLRTPAPSICPPVTDTSSSRADQCYEDNVVWRMPRQGGTLTRYLGGGETAAATGVAPEQIKLPVNLEAMSVRRSDGALLVAPVSSPVVVRPTSGGITLDNLDHALLELSGTPDAAAVEQVWRGTAYPSALSYVHARASWVLSGGEGDSYLAIWTAPAPVTPTPTPVTPTSGVLPEVSFGPIKFSYTASDAASGTTFQVRKSYRSVAGTTKTLISDTANSFFAVAKPLPGTYCFQARSVLAGKTSAWSQSVCTVVPVDDRQLRARGQWKRVRAEGAYRGTQLLATKAKAAVTLERVSGRQIGLVVPRCQGCGSMTVLVNGKAIGTVSEATSTTTVATARTVVWLPASGEIRGPVVIRTTSGAKTYIDGVVVR